MNSSKPSDGEAESVDERSLYKMLEERRAAGLPTSAPSEGPDLIPGTIKEANVLRAKVGLPLLPEVDEGEEGDE